ncbi:MAG: hypothetical protein ACP5RS_00105 [Thermoplasmata archaeon]
MKVDSSTFMWIAILVILVVVEILEIGGVISYQLIAGNLMFFVFSVVIIAILAIIGAMFIGILISKRLYNKADLSLFEIEMLRMKKDVEEIKEMLKKNKR